jgi:hypothetical protein
MQRRRNWRNRLLSPAITVTSASKRNHNRNPSRRS